MSPLDGWSDFYVIAGAAAGGLIGLQFVVITLIAERPRPRLSEATQAFSTPTIVHFVAVLLLSALITAPWQSIAPLSKIWGLFGLAGLFYSGRVGLYMKRQPVYRPELSDWFFYFAFPACAYLILLVAMVVSQQNERLATFAVAAAVLILLAVGIHNAWDTVVYHVTSLLERLERGN
jgi:hypothetical protein